MKILVAVLHWGLGHASRCIPIINDFLDEGHEVILASDGAALTLLKKEFPALESVVLPAYNIRYPTSSMLWNLMIQSRSFFWAIKGESVDIQTIVKKNKIEMIVSDNRFGCFSPLVKKNIFITHQLNLLTPFGLLDAPARWLNHRFLKRFDEIWIPDYEKESESLAGKLSHGHLEKLPKIVYIGAKSRFVKNIKTATFDFFDDFKNKGKKILVVLSGPEPQRTFLEEKIIEQARFLKSNFLIIRGLADNDKIFFLQENIKIFDHATSKELNEMMLTADFIITRSGYSTVMDLMVLEKNALLIPTPGQSEQIYLAQRLQTNPRFSIQSQEKLDLSAFDL